MNQLRLLLRWFVLIWIAVIAAGPFVWILVTALKGSEDIFAFPPALLPQDPGIRNFVEVFAIVPFGTYLLNSVLVSLASVVLNLLLASLAAYPLARMDFRGRRWVFLMILATLMVPEQVTMIPVFRLLLEMGLLDTLAGVVLPTCVSAFGVFLIRQHYRSIPRELDEAAVMDGCSVLGIWWRILVPLSAPALATLAVFTFVGTWSSFLWPLIVLQDPARYTLPVGLNALLSAFSANYKYLAAGAVLTLIPVVAVLLFFQRYLVRGMLAGGVKG